MIEEAQLLLYLDRELTELEELEGNIEVHSRYNVNEFRDGLKAAHRKMIDKILELTTKQ